MITLQNIIRFFSVKRYNTCNNDIKEYGRAFREVKEFSEKTSDHLRKTAAVNGNKLWPDEDDGTT